MSDAETCGLNISLMKFLKGDKQYIPGNTFNYTFEGKDLDTGKRKDLEALLVKKKRRIQKYIKNLTTKERLILKGKKVNFSCLFSTCNFVGNKLKRHLMTKAHSMGEKSATLHESFLNHQIKHTTLVLKHNQMKPLICSDCHLCFSRLGDHLANNDQIKRGSGEFLKKIKDSRKFTRFTENFIKNDDKEAESDDLREDDECQSTKDTTTKVSQTKENLQKSPKEHLEKSPGQKEKQKQ